MKHIFRLIRKNKVFSIVNILGLSIGLASAIIIFLFVEFEISFDNFYKDGDQIYRVTRSNQYAMGTELDGATSYPMAYSLRNDFPDFDITTFYMLGSADVLFGEKVYKEDNILFVDSAFFSVFNYNWIYGSPELITERPENIAITASLAKKYFGTENPVGKKITLSPDMNFQIVGLIEDLPINSTHQFSMLLSIENLSDDIVGYSYDSWEITMSGFESYFKIHEKVDISDLERRMNEIIISKYEDSKDRATQTHHKFQPIRKVHLSPEYENMPNTYSTSNSNLWIYALIGLLIIAIAGINFINLSTAQGLKRAKEVGVRKVLGASRSKLSLLFIKENALISFIGLVFAVIIVEIVLPYINIFLGNNHELSIYNSRLFVFFFILIYLVVNVIIALYPSFVMSRFTPIKALKGSINAPKQNTFSLRNMLLIFQFTISIALIIATIVIRKQINYINNIDLGFKTEHIIKFDLPEKDSAKIQTLRNYLRTELGVKSFGMGMTPPASNGNFLTSFKVEGEDENVKHYLNLKPVDYTYNQVFDIELLAGEWFDERAAGDSVFRIVANEKYYKTLGFKSPQDALNKRFPFIGNQAIICGVVKDFYVYSLHEEIEPTAFVSIPRFYSSVFVSIDANRLKESIENINDKMTKIYPTYYIEYKSVENEIDELYVNENRISTIITVLAALAILIAVMGLFGLVSFMIVQRVNEIGMRKVLGATLNQIAIVFTKTYIRLILVASLFAIPLAWYFMNRWLNGFSYRIEIALWIYFLAIFLTLIIALLVILIQVVKAGRMNPVKALKYE